jgi:hypothetical protein
MRSGNRVIAGLALAATLALVIGIIAGPSASASDPVAHTAGLKKCLKKAKSISDPVKRKRAKRRCRRKFGAQVPLVRANLTWLGADSPSTDLDLFVFDTSGHQAGNGSDTIPSSLISPDARGQAGNETFTDLIPNPLRTFSFGVCYTVGGSAHAPFTITYVTADGVTHTDSQNPGSSFHFNYPAGAPIPSNYCPA